MRKTLTVVALAAFSAVAYAGKVGTPAVGSGTGSVIGNDAIERALQGDISEVEGVSLYERLLPLPETILLEDGRILSPDTYLANGSVIVLTVAPNGKITDVTILERDVSSGQPAGGACGA